MKINYWEGIEHIKAAIDLFKYPPCLKVPNSQVVFEKDVYGLKEDYMPKNANKKYGGEYTLML
mgnify:CR=1 FL=1